MSMTDWAARDLDLWLSANLLHTRSYYEGGADFSLSETGEGMLRVLGAMAQRGYSCGLFYCDNGAQHGASFYNIGARPYSPLEVSEHLHHERRVGTAGNASLPMCVARAARITLEASRLETETSGAVRPRHDGVNPNPEAEK